MCPINSFYLPIKSYIFHRRALNFEWLHKFNILCLLKVLENFESPISRTGATPTLDEWTPVSVVEVDKLISFVLNNTCVNLMTHTWLVKEMRVLYYRSSLHCY